MYDPQNLLATTINGQLMLLMLCEKLTDIGVTIDSTNTDGISMLYSEDIHEQVEEICRQWEGLTKMSLEAVEYTKVVRRDINNYLAFYEGGVKEKGMFLTNPPIDQSHDFVVIPKAIRAYYEHGTPIEEFITNHRQIYDFCASMKCSKDYTVHWNSEIQQHLNRYFVTRGGAYLYKSKDGKNMNHMLKDTAVQLFNDFYEAKWEDYKIDTRWYVSEVKKIINELEPRQTSLF